MRPYGGEITIMIQIIGKKLKKIYKRYKHEKEQLCKKAQESKALVIKIIPHGKNFMFSYRLTPKHIFTLIALVLFISASLFIWSQRTSLRLAMANRKLEKQNKQITQLLEKQNREIIKQLDEIKKQDNEVRKIVGLKPSSKGLKSNIKSSRRGLSQTELAARIKDLQKEVQKTKKDQESLRKHAVKYRIEKEKEKIVKKLAAMPSRWPVSGYISSGFGRRIHPLYGGSNFHTGLDIIAEYGAPIYATAAGYVTQADYEGGYGYAVKIDHGNGYQTMYAHCSSMAVNVGQSVNKGQLIAYVGCSGTTTGSHVHYEVFRAGERINPETCLNTESIAYKTLAMRIKKTK